MQSGAESKRDVKGAIAPALSCGLQPMQNKQPEKNPSPVARMQSGAEDRCSDKGGIAPHYHAGNSQRKTSNQKKNRHP